MSAGNSMRIPADAGTVLDRHLEAPCRVAVVGSGPLDQSAAAAIDRCDFVIRINNFVLNEWSGRRTDAVFLNRPGTLADMDASLSSFCETVPLFLVDAAAGLNRLASPEAFSFHGFPEFRYRQWRATVGVAESYHLLTGVVAALEVAERQSSVHLFGFDFYHSGPVYYYDNPVPVSQGHMARYHCLEIEERFVRSHRGMIVHTESGSSLHER